MLPLVIVSGARATHKTARELAVTPVFMRLTTIVTMDFVCFICGLVMVGLESEVFRTAADLLNIEMSQKLIPVLDAKHGISVPLSLVAQHI